MTTYIIRRMIIAIVVLILVSIIVFFIMRLLPGDPVLLFISQSELTSTLTDEGLAQLHHQFGLDKPLGIQYFNWIINIFRGNFGDSIFYHDKVSRLLLERYPITLHLGILAFILSGTLGIFLGLIAALRRGKWIDTVATIIAYIGITIPSFWLGILLIYLLSLELHWLPTSGYISPFDDFWESTRKIIMPVICLATVSLASTARQTRSSMLEVIKQDYIRTAWSKGLSEKLVITRHALKNSLIPVITLMGMSVSVIFGGSVLIETVFAIPGVGRLLVSSILSHDYGVVQSIILLIAIMVVIVNLLIDVSYGWLDPRIRYS